MYDNVITYCASSGMKTRTGRTLQSTEFHSARRQRFLTIRVRFRLGTCSGRGATLENHRMGGGHWLRTRWPKVSERKSSASFRREKRRQQRGEVMKKATTKMVTMTMEEVRKRKIPKAEMERLKRLAAMPDEQIDTSDIPELTNFAGGVRGRF